MYAWIFIYGENVDITRVYKLVYRAHGHQNRAKWIPDRELGKGNYIKTILGRVDRLPTKI